MDDKRARHFSLPQDIEGSKLTAMGFSYIWSKNYNRLKVNTFIALFNVEKGPIDGFEGLNPIREEDCGEFLKY